MQERDFRVGELKELLKARAEFIKKLHEQMSARQKRLHDVLHQKVRTRYRWLSSSHSPK